MARQAAGAAAANKPKRAMSEAQKAALARGRVNRSRNIAGRRASRARQGVSASTSRQLLDLAQQATAGQEEAAASASASQPDSVLSTSSSGNSKTAKKLSPEEQDALLFSFAMGDDEQAATDSAAAAPSGKGAGLRGKLSDLITRKAPSDATPGGITDQQERDAQQAAAQWEGLVAVVFVFLGARTFGPDLQPSPDMASAMAAPLCRIAMRHIDPLRTASADTYDIIAFMTACIVYYQTIEPALRARRSERLIVNAVPTQAQPAQPGQPGGQQVPAGPAGNVSYIPADRAARSGRHDEATPANRSGSDDANQRQQPNDDVGTAIFKEALDIQI